MANSTGDDGDCWERALAGDPSGVAELYDRHATAIYNHCRQRLDSPADAEDITADVFIVAMQTAQIVFPHPDAGLRPWLLAVANNLLRRHAKTRGIAERALRRLPTERRNVPDIADRVADRSADNYHLRLLADVLSALPVADRELIQLCVLQGIAPGVVADITGSRPGTVRSRLSRALGRARRALDQHEKSLPATAGRRPLRSAAIGLTTIPTQPEFERGS